MTIKRGWISVAVLALVSLAAFGILSAFGARSQEGVSFVSLEPVSVVAGPMGPFEAPDLADEPKRTPFYHMRTAITAWAPWTCLGQTGPYRQGQRSNMVQRSGPSANSNLGDTAKIEGGLAQASPLAFCILITHLRDR